MGRLIYRFAAAAAVCVATICAAQAQEQPTRVVPPNTLAIHGEGTYEVKPERATFSLTVTTTGAAAQAARDPHPAMVTKVRALIDGLASEGLTIERASYGFVEDQPNRYVASDKMTDKERNRIVYTATTVFTLTTENLVKINDMISVLAAADAEMSSVSFTVKNERAPLLQARKAAASDALEQAKAYAEALEVELVDIRDVTDGEASPPTYSDGEADLMVMTPAGGAAPRQLSIVVPDTLAFTASVNVDWTIKAKPQP
jgi:uncharacterized protein YggE